MTVNVIIVKVAIVKSKIVVVVIVKVMNMIVKVEMRKIAWFGIEP